MLENLKNKLKGIATESQREDEENIEIEWHRNFKGNMVDEYGNRVAGNLEEKEG